MPGAGLKAPSLPLLAGVCWQGTQQPIPIFLPPLTLSDSLTFSCFF